VRTVYVIGIGAGDPDHVTAQAVAAMNRVQVFLTVDKGPDKDDLAALRTGLLARHVTGPHRVVQVPDPRRERVPGTAAEADYTAAVDDWQARREALYQARDPRRAGRGRRRRVPGVGRPGALRRHPAHPGPHPRALR
jgi:precorrin-6A synthase